MRHKRRFTLWSAAGFVWLIGVLAVPPGWARTTQPTTTASAPASAPTEIIATEVVKLVGQSDAATRLSAASAILRTGPEGSAALLTILSTPNNTNAKQAVCQAITEMGAQAPEFIAPLQALLTSDEPALRKAAATALSTYSDPEVTDRLRAFRNEEERTALRASLVKLMAGLYERTTAEADRAALLQGWLQSELSVERYKALDLIHEQLRTKGAKPTNGVLAAIRSLTADPDENVRQKTVAVLRDMGLLEDARLIRSMLEWEKSAATREEIFKALGKLGDPASIPACIEGLDDPSEKVTAAAADALGRLCDQSTGKPSDSIEEVAAALLGRMAQPVKTMELRTDLIEAMADIAAPSFAPVLIAHAGASEPEAAIRQAAIRGLGRIGAADQTAAAAIIDRLTNDTNNGVREVAAVALGFLGNDQAALEALRTRLDPAKEPSTAVQSQAWDAYQKVFAKLPLDAQDEALAVWNGGDADAIERKVTLLGTMETQQAGRNSNSAALAVIREQLGDALAAGNQLEQAAGAWSRAIAVLPPEQAEPRARVTRKAVDAWLSTGEVGPVLALAAKTTRPEVRDAIAEPLLAHLRTLDKTDRAAAAKWLDAIGQQVPDRFGQRWADAFDALRQPPPEEPKEPAANQEGAGVAPPASAPSVSNAQ